MGKLSKGRSNTGGSDVPGIGAFEPLFAPGGNIEEARLAKAVALLRESVEGMDRGRALFTVLSLFLGHTADEEVAVCDPDTGNVLAYLVPPRFRHERQAAWRREQPES